MHFTCTDWVIVYLRVCVQARAMSLLAMSTCTTPADLMQNQEQARISSRWAVFADFTC